MERMKNKRDERKQKNEKNIPLSTAYNVLVGNIESKCLCSRKYR